MEAQEQLNTTTRALDAALTENHALRDEIERMAAVLRDVVNNAPNQEPKTVADVASKYVSFSRLWAFWVAAQRAQKVLEDFGLLEDE